MINFIVCEDNKIILQKNINIINKVMFNNNLNYRIYPFNNYNDDLKRVIKSSGEKKIYILDIELDNKSGIEIAREIRKDDLDSFIVISTAHTEYLPYTLKSKLLIFDFVSKFDDYESSVSKVINNILDEYPETKKLVIKAGKTITEINFDDIISLKYDSRVRKTVIKTNIGDYEVNKPLISLTKDLDQRFQKQDDGIIINTNHNSNNLYKLYQQETNKEVR